MECQSLHTYGWADHCSSSLYRSRKGTSMTPKNPTTRKTRTHPNKKEAEPGSKAKGSVQSIPEEKPVSEATAPVQSGPDKKSSPSMGELIRWIGIGFILGLGLAMLLLQNGAALCEINLGPLKFTLPCSSKPLLTCGDYDITITGLEDKANGVMSVMGTYVDAPPVDNVLLILKSSAGDYFFQKPILIDPGQRTWQGEITLGDDARKDFVILVSLMGNNGKALFNYYNKVGAETGRWPAIETLTDDIEVCDRRSIPPED